MTRRTRRACKGRMRAPDGGLLRTYNRGSAKIDGFLDDHAHLLDVADANLQVAFAVFAAAYEGRVQRDSDCRGGGRRLLSRRIGELFTDL